MQRVQRGLISAWLLAVLCGATSHAQQPAVQEHADSAEAYLRLLDRAGRTADPDEVVALRWHVARLAPVAPDSILLRVVDGALDTPPETWTFRPEASEHLLAWWRRLDPRPATPENERVAEHLHRLAYADAHYAHNMRFHRLDDRGLTYVRYGPPSERTSVSHADAEFVRDVFRFGVPVSSSDFPKNELWFYRHISPEAYYLFVRQGRHYRRAKTTTELLPASLQGGFSRSEYGLNKAVSAVAALRHIYEQLALYHIDFGPRYTAVENYAEWQEQEAMRADMGLPERQGQQRIQVGEGMGQQRVVTEDRSAGVPLPSEFVQETLEQSRREDVERARVREEVVPEQRTALFDTVGHLPIALRTARFLDADGTTRTELYWAVHADGLALAQEHREDPQAASAFLIGFSAVRQTTDYRRREMHHSRYLLQPVSSQHRLLAPQTDSVSGDTGTYHLGLEWDLYLADDRMGGLKGPLVGMHVRRLDSLHALHADAAQLEISDLKPLLLVSLDDAIDPGSLHEALPYPYPTITEAVPLALYFEVYHLAFGSSDRTHYTIEYEVRQRRGRGMLARLLRGDERWSTAAATMQTGTDRTAHELVVVDLSKLDIAPSTELIVTVYVTDETTQQTAERDISFEWMQ